MESRNSDTLTDSLMLALRRAIPGPRQVLLQVAEPWNAALDRGSLRGVSSPVSSGGLHRQRWLGLSSSWRQGL